MYMQGHSWRLAASPPCGHDHHNSGNGIATAFQAKASYCCPTETDAEQRAPYVPVSWLPLVQEQASAGSISNQVGVRQHSTWKKGAGERAQHSRQPHAQPSAQGCAKALTPYVSVACLPVIVQRDASGGVSNNVEMRQDSTCRGCDGGGRPVGSASCAWYTACQQAPCLGTITRFHLKNHQGEKVPSTPAQKVFGLTPYHKPQQTTAVCASGPADQ
jgi:hypothetical protein